MNQFETEQEGMQAVRVIRLGPGGCVAGQFGQLASFRCKLTLATLNDSMSRATKVSQEQEQPHLHSELCT